jgi:drug/metabolite transporter (DMT)-like permease
MMQNSFSLLVNYYALRFFPLTTVAMVMNLSPMITVFLAFFILGERITRSQLIVLVLAFSAVSIMILGGDQKDDKNYQTNIFALLVLFLNPFVISLGTIAMRAMQKTSEWTVSGYNNLF